MSKRKYAEYLSSGHWANLRRAVFERDRYRCVRCSSTQFIQAHHLRYRGAPTNSRIEDLETLCDCCHAKIHGKRPKVTDWRLIDSPLAKAKSQRKMKSERKKQLKAISDQARSNNLMVSSNGRAKLKFRSIDTSFQNFADPSIRFL